jgi:ABC-type antimicrobial peptide transport system permease subunit
MGCEVRHQLEEQRQLVQLAMAVAILVILFVSGSVTNACFNSGAVSWMDLTTRSKEIGIKMAHGLTRGDIILANLAEGGLVGVISCVFGVLVVWWSHPMLRRLIQQTMGFGDEFYLIGVIAMATAWLYACAAAVVIGFNVLGAFVPTCLALRKAPVELLRE